MFLDLDSKNVTPNLNPDLQEQNQMSLFSSFIFIYLYTHIFLFVSLLTQLNS